MCVPSIDPTALETEGQLLGVGRGGGRGLDVRGAMDGLVGDGKGVGEMVVEGGSKEAAVGLGVDGWVIRIIKGA